MLEDFDFDEVCFLDDIPRYITYQEHPEKINELHIEDMRIYDLLTANGFSIVDIGTFYLKELISFINNNILTPIPNLSYEELKKLVQNKESYLYVEVALIYLEVGRDKFIDAIRNANKRTNDDIEFEEKAILFSKYAVKDKMKRKRLSECA